jgi:RNA polymerase sigma factor (TIGR02999 family)
MDLTTILRTWRDPDPSARERLMSAVYQELRRLAASHLRREREGHTFTPTVLVHELYLRILDQEDLSFEDRRSFFAYTSSAMRGILVDHARQRKAEKRGGGAAAVELPDSLSQDQADAEEVIAVHEALERLEALDPAQARIVEYRYFSGLTTAEIARLMDLSEQDVDREWRLARAWLKRKLQ